MSNVKKLMMTAAGGGESLNVEDVFSTYLYDGTSATRTITNGIDLSTEGGLIWTKQRNSSADDHWLVDTERGVNIGLKTNSTQGSDTGYSNVTSFNTDGYSLGTQDVTNESPFKHVSWTFRKAPKFFDVVTYTGNSTAGRTVSHNLGSVPGMIIVKRLDLTTHWAVYHRGMHPTSPEDYYMRLNDTLARQDSSSWWNDTAPTSTEFTLGSSSTTNGTGSPFVAYLFAHNNGDGTFGPDGDADIIKCGSYTGNGSSTGPVINLGFEPQWVIIKNASSSGPWVMLDNMRGWPVTDDVTFNDHMLWANTSDAEYTTVKRANITPTGFQIRQNNSQVNTNGNTYIYIAIRRGPMAVPESGTDVFAANNGDGSSSNPGLISGFPVDFGWYKFITLPSDNHVAWSRLTQGKSLALNTTAAEIDATQAYFDYMNGMGTAAYSTNLYSWMWRRAPNYFDVVAYSGDGTGDITLNHNLGVDPEMVWVKGRNISSAWHVAHKVDFSKYLRLETDDSFINFRVLESSSSTQFTLDSFFNSSNQNWTAYLFASLDGVSKVGSYTGNGTSQTIDCGFTSGARFILIKRTDSTGDWPFWDTERGIVAGNDPFLELNTTSAQNSSYDSIDPDSSGFIVNQDAGTNINVSSATYIFYAIA